MPSTCCVPGCKSNYKTSNEGNVAVFRFPSDEETSTKWVKAINRADFQPTKSSVVCIKHFDKSQIISEDNVIRPDGSVLTVPRSHMKLISDALPWNFADAQPKYLTVPPSRKRKAPSERIESAINRDEERFNEWCKEDEIGSFDNFKSVFSDRSLGDFFHKVCDDFVVFFKVEVSACPVVTISVKVFSDLSVKVFYT